MRAYRPYALGLGIAISALFLWFAFRGLHPIEVWGNIQRAELGWLLAGVGTYFIAVTVIALRWQYLLRAVKPIPLRHLVPLVAIGYMGNNVYPFRSGEVLRIVLLRRNHTVPIAKGTTTVAVERVFDGIVMLTFIIIPLLFIEVPSAEVRTVAVFAAPIFLTALVLFFILATRPNILRRLSAFASRPLPERLQTMLLNISEDIISGLEGLRSPTDLAGAVVSSFLTWAIEASVYWLVSFAFHLNVSYPVMLLTVGAVNLAGLLPASPGQVGVFEFFASAALVAVGVDEAQAKAFALVVHLVIWLPVTLVGFYFLIQQGLSWQAIVRPQQLETEALT